MTGAPFDAVAACKVMRALASGDWSGVEDSDVAAVSPSNADRPYRAWKAVQRGEIAELMMVQVIELITKHDGGRRALIAINPEFRIAAGEILAISRPI